MRIPRPAGRETLRHGVCYDRARNGRPRAEPPHVLPNRSTSKSSRLRTPEEIPLSEPESNPPADANPAATARPPWLLFLGAAIGLAIATYGLVEARSEARALPDTTAAVVGERTIRTVDYQRVLAGVEGDLRSPIDDALRRRVLDRMIDEELLVQRALDLGLAVVDRRVRGELTSGLIDSIVSEADAQEASAREIARHYEKNVDFFTRPGRLRVQTLFFSNRKDDDGVRPSAARRVSLAADRLGRLDEVQTVERELADAQVSPVPNALLPASKVRDYVGPTLLERVSELDVGIWSAPIETPTGYSLALLLEREPAIVPKLEAIEDLVRQDLKRRRGDEALRQYLDDLRGEVVVWINESALEMQD